MRNLFFFYRFVFVAIAAIVVIVATFVNRNPTVAALKVSAQLLVGADVSCDGLDLREVNERIRSTTSQPLGH